MVEKQSALSFLPTLDRPEAFDLLEKWLKALSDKKAPNEIALDILTAAGQSNHPRSKTFSKPTKTKRSKEDDLANFRETLYGGDIARGKDIS